MVVIYMLLIMSVSDRGMAGGFVTQSAVPYWSMAECQKAKKTIFPDGSPDAICIAFKSEEWQR